MSRIAAIMIGRGGSSLRDKNIMPVAGVPLLLWAAAAARRSRYITDFYISSDDVRIRETAARAGYRPVVRPAELAAQNAKSCDAVRHAYASIPDTDQPDIVVVQHANIATITEAMIDECIELLMSDPSLSSVVPAHRVTENHPLWARTLNSDGLIEPLVPGSPSPNRQELPEVLFYDHSFWVLRRSAILGSGGQPPWPCMGDRIHPYETDGGADVHTIGDIAGVEAWLVQNEIPTPQF